MIVYVVLKEFDVKVIRIMVKIISNLLFVYFIEGFLFLLLNGEFSVFKINRYLLLVLFVLIIMLIGINVMENVKNILKMIFFNF